MEDAGAAARGTRAGLTGEGRISGYAALFGVPDQGGDVVLPGAFSGSLLRRARTGRPVRMLWQHEAGRPVGIWDRIAEDARGLRVSGRLLREVAQAREAEALIAGGALDGLSVGYRVLRAGRDAQGRRLLAEVDLWEISLVTFPMQSGARIERRSAGLLPRLLRMTGSLSAARAQLPGR